MTDLNALAAEYAALDDDARGEHLARLDAEDAERDRRLRAPGALAAAAGWYASQNIRIFPCEVGGKKPLARLARNGLKNASSDPEQVKAWWTAEPQANIGMPTGHGFDVIDVDGPVGWSSWVDLEPKVPFIAKVHTGGGGLHVYVAATGRGNGAHLKPGIDYRGAGGYVVAPPSRHSSGDIYRWHPDTPATLLTGGAA